MFGKPTSLPTPDQALPGRAAAMPVPERHFVNGNRIVPPFPEGLALADFGLGCFWGAEKAFWKLPGVYATAVGYQGGATPNPTYREVCTGRTGHAEVVRVIHDPAKIPYDDLLRTFWESHDPTQGMRQGNDVGTQYRSAIFFTSEEQRKTAEAVKARVGRSGKWKHPIVTQIVAAGEFTRAEEHHQKYLEKNPGGYMCHYLRD